MFGNGLFVVYLLVLLVLVGGATWLLRRTAHVVLSRGRRPAEPTAHRLR